MTAWLTAVGRADAPLPDAWLADGRAPTRTGRTGFPRRPRMAPGDRVVLYAPGWRCVFGIAEVTGEPRDTPIDGRRSDRWPWWVPIEPLLVVPLLANAPPVEAIGVRARSMSQQSHIRLRPAHYERAIEVLSSVAR